MASREMVAAKRARYPGLRRAQNSSAAPFENGSGRGGGLRYRGGGNVIFRTRIGIAC